MLRDQFRFRRLPWWVVFVLAIYAVLKVYSVYDSPCAVLGVSSPAHQRQVPTAGKGLRYGRSGAYVQASERRRRGGLRLRHGRHLARRDAFIVRL